MRRAVKSSGIICLLCAGIILFRSAYAADLSFEAGGLNRSFPGPTLLYPATDDIDLKGSAGLEFKWERVDSVGTRNYDFRLYKGYQATAANLVLKKSISVDEYPFKIDPDICEVNQTYTWVLTQVTYDGRKSDKSFSSFKIIKK